MVEVNDEDEQVCAFRAITIDFNNNKINSIGWLLWFPDTIVDIDYWLGMADFAQEGEWV